MAVMKTSWWDEVPYSENEQQPFAMQIEAQESFNHPCGFVPLKERHRVKAIRQPVNAVDRRCRIGRVKLK